MLHGLWLPIYGTGCVLMAVIEKQVGSKPARYFMICMVASGVLEYTTSWLMEAIYHKRWWDYSNFPLNLQGHIFARGLVRFAVAVCIFGASSFRKKVQSDTVLYQERFYINYGDCFYF